MNQVNWGRLVAGGMAAFLVMFISDALIHENVLDADWKAVFSRLGAPQPPDHGAAIAYFAVFDLGRAFLGAFLYVLMREFTGIGPRTAVLAGVVAWLVFSVAGPAQFIPLMLYSNELWVKVAGFQLVTCVLGALIAGWLYKERADG